MDWNGIWNSIVNFFSNNVWNIVKFFAILILGYFACKLIIKLVRKILSKTKLEQLTQKFFMSALKVFVWVIYVMTLLKVIGVDLTGVVAALAACAVAVGLALENSLSNLASGLILVSSKMINCGDYIAVNGVEGTVDNIGLLETCIRTVDNKTIYIPNSAMVNNSLTNYSTQKTRRLDFDFDVDYATDINKAKQVVLNVLNSNGKIRLDPAPTCRLKTLKDSSLSLFTTCWVDSEDYWDVFYYVTDRVFDEFKKNNIDIPFNQLEVRLRNDEVVSPVYSDSLPKRVEKVRQEEIEGDFIDQLIVKQQKKSRLKRQNKLKEKQDVLNDDKKQTNAESKETEQKQDKKEDNK